MQQSQSVDVLVVLLVRMRPSTWLFLSLTVSSPRCPQLGRWRLYLEVFQARRDNVLPALFGPAVSRPVPAADGVGVQVLAFLPVHGHHLDQHAVLAQVASLERLVHTWRGANNFHCFSSLQIEWFYITTPPPPPLVYLNRDSRGGCLVRSSKTRLSLRKYVPDVTSRWSASVAPCNSVKGEKISSRAQTPVFVAHNLRCDKCTGLTYHKVTRLSIEFLGQVSTFKRTWRLATKTFLNQSFWAVTAGSKCRWPHGTRSDFRGVTKGDVTLVNLQRQLARPIRNACFSHEFADMLHFWIAFKNLQPVAALQISRKIVRNRPLH